MGEHYASVPTLDRIHHHPGANLELFGAYGIYFKLALKFRNLLVGFCRRFGRFVVIDCANPGGE